MGKYPQESYAVVVHSIQPEWKFLQRVKNNTGDALKGVEKMLQETFLSCLFFGKSKSLSPIIGTLSTIPFKRSGLGLLNPVTPAK